MKNRFAALEELDDIDTLNKNMTEKIHKYAMPMSIEVG